jgi:hypothetical protein
MDEPRLQAWIQDYAGPDPGYEARPGRWVAESGWPASSVAAAKYWLGNHTLSDAAPVEQAAISHESPQAPTSDRGNWCPAGFRSGGKDFPPEQSAEDEHSATFTSEPLTIDLELLGFPRLRAEVAADAPNAMLVARLCDVAPDGSSTLVSRGFLNLCHRNGSESPEPLTPGERYSVELELRSIGYVVPVGHRLRLGISTTYWPWVWPSPAPVRITVRTGTSSLELPVRKATQELASVEFELPESEAALETEPTGPTELGSREINRDPTTGTVEITDVVASRGERLLRSGITYDAGGRSTFRIREGQPLTAAIDCTRFFTFGRNGWDTRTQVTSSMSSTEQHFHVTTLLEAFENDSRIFTKTWSAAIARNCV